MNPCPASWGGRKNVGGGRSKIILRDFPFLLLLYFLHLGNVATGIAMALHYQAFITVSCKDLEHFKWFYKKLG